MLCIIVFAIGFISLFFSKKIKNWYANFLQALPKKQLFPFYKTSLDITNKNWFIINLKVCGLLEMLVALLMIVLIIYRLRYPDKYR